jgi:hypothetical protein
VKSAVEGFPQLPQAIPVGLQFLRRADQCQVLSWRSRAGWLEFQLARRDRRRRAGSQEGGSMPVQQIRPCAKATVRHNAYGTSIGDNGGKSPTAPPDSAQPDSAQPDRASPEDAPDLDAAATGMAMLLRLALRAMKDGGSSSRTLGARRDRNARKRSELR